MKKLNNIFFCIKNNTHPKDIYNTNEPQQYGPDIKRFEEKPNSLLHIAKLKNFDTTWNIIPINNKNNKDICPIFNSINDKQK